MMDANVVRYTENESLVYYVLHREFASCETDEDVIQEAKLALWKACISYDSERTMFSTYAYHVIRNAIHSLLRRESTTVEQKLGDGLISLDAAVAPEETSDDKARSIESLSGTEEDNFAVLEHSDIMLRVLNEKELLLCQKLASGATQQALAKEEGLTRQALNNRIMKIRKKLEACGMLA